MEFITNNPLGDGKKEGAKYWIFIVLPTTKTLLEISCTRLGYEWNVRQQSHELLSLFKATFRPWNLLCRISHRCEMCFVVKGTIRKDPQMKIIAITNIFRSNSNVKFYLEKIISAENSETICF